MRIKLQQAEAARIEIDLPHPDGRPRTVCLTELRGASGGVERVAAGQAGSEVRVRGGRAASVVLDHFDWPLPGGARLSATSPAGLAGVSLELDAAGGDRAPVSGRAAVTRASGRAIAIELAGNSRLVLDIDGRAGAVEISPERIGYASAERLDLGNLQTAIAGYLVRASSGALERVRVDWQSGEVLVGAGAAHLGGATVTADGITAEIDRVELPGGLRTSGRALVIPELVVPEVRIAVDDLVAALGDRAPGRPGRPASESDRFHFDFGFLDRVTGRIDVDLTMELAVPVIGKREATHHFRIPIVGGALNYRELERDLASIEDAFIDLEVRGRSLALERRIPLLGMEKPLVVWELTPDELELAKKRLVRLRTVPRMQLVRSGGSGGDKGPIAVRRLRFGSVEIELALAPPGGDQPDAIGHLSVANLKVRGELRYDPKREGPLTRAELAIERLGAGPFEVAAGPARIEVERIEVGSVEGQVEFAGVRPRGARLTARGALLRNLKIALPALVGFLLLACGGDDGPPVGRADARRPPDAGPSSDARIGVDCEGAACDPTQTCCGEQLEPPYFTYVCVPDGETDGCRRIFDCDGPEDCPSGLCCGGTRIECAPEGTATCSGGATVCHQDEDCGGGQCCPTPSGVVRECVGPC